MRTLIVTAALVFASTAGLNHPEVTVTGSSMQQAGFAETGDQMTRFQQPFSGRLAVVDEHGQRLQAMSYRQGKLDGLVEEWYADGHRKAIHWYQSGRRTGQHAGWWPNGQRRFTCGFADDVYDGTLTEWSATGQMTHRGHFTAGHEQGLQQHWRSDGTLFASYTVENGRTYGLYGSVSCAAR